MSRRIVIHFPPEQIDRFAPGLQDESALIDYLRNFGEDVFRWLSGNK